MLSYHSNKILKDLVVSEMKNHLEKDQFIKGSYNKEDSDGKFKGCAVGCAIDSVNKVLGKFYDTGDHKALEKAIGVPEWLARLQDIIFEGLPIDENSQFAVNFLEAIPVGISLEPIKWKFCTFILKENIERVLVLPGLSDKLKGEVVGAIKGILNIHESAINSGAWDQESAELAARSAWSVRAAVLSARPIAAWPIAAWPADEIAAVEAVEAAVRSAAAWSAEAAVQAAVRSAEAAAWLAAEAEAAAWSAAAAYKIYATELIRLLKNEELLTKDIQGE